jgi:hypothetical protein
MLSSAQAVLLGCSAVQFMIPLSLSSVLPIPWESFARSSGHKMFRDRVTASLNGGMWKCASSNADRDEKTDEP